MKNRYVLFTILLIVLSITFLGCKGKIEDEAEVEEPQQVEADLPLAFPHKAEDIRKWISNIAADAYPGAMEKAEEVAGKFSAEEIVAAIAVKPKPDYWDDVPEEKKLKTVSIMNTTFSKLRIKAGLAEDENVLNSTLYIEDKDGMIIAVSDPQSGTLLYTFEG